MPQGIKPITEQRYKYSFLSIFFAKVGIVFFSLMILVGIYTAIENLLAKANLRVFLFDSAYILIFLIGAWASFTWLKKKKGYITISNDGITEYSIDEGRTFIPWGEVERIKYGRIYGGLLIVSNNKKYVRIMNGIEHPETIEKALFKHTEAYRNFRNKNIVLRWLEKIGIFI